MFEDEELRCEVDGSQSNAERVKGLWPPEWVNPSLRR